MIILLFNFFIGTAMATYPNDFVSLSDLCPGLIIRAVYATNDNFTGQVVRGYKARKALCSRRVGLALCKVQEEAESLGLSLMIFDSYRPAKAVAFFQKWAQLPETDPDIKQLYYPSYSRNELFELGYIAKQSSHSRGSAIDLTLFDLKKNKELDMGSPFDYFDSLSRTDSPLITQDQKENRQVLKRLMEEEGFKNFSKEWWHYSFILEPFPDQYFDFDVE
jgi:zinc D-Ala-D-Ala dipeptidase